MEIRTRLVNYMKELGDKDLCVAFFRRRGQLSYLKGSL